MKNKNVRGLLALVVVTALSFGVILGSKALAQDTGAGNGSGEAQRFWKNWIPRALKIFRKQ